MEKYSVYDNYKKNISSLKLYEYPSHWAILRAKYICNEINARSKKGDETLLSVSEYFGVKPRSDNIDEGDLLTRAESLEGYKKCKQDDLVINIMLAWKKGLGVTPMDGIVSPAYAVYRFKKSIVPHYIHYLLRTDLYISLFKSRSTGVIDSRLRLYPESFFDIPILLPSFEEQKHIANFLNYETKKIDALIDKQQNLISLLQEKRQALISHAVTKGLSSNVSVKGSGVDWIREVPEHWIIAGFKKYLSSIVDYRGKTPNKVDDGMFLVTARNIKNGVINYSLSQEYVSKSDYVAIMGRGLPSIGDVLFTTEAPLGEVAQVDNVNIALAQRIIKFRGKNKVLDNTYLKYYMMSTEFQDSLMIFATGSTALGIKAERLGYLIQLIPPMQEQLEIISYLKKEINKLDVLEAKAKNGIDLMSERRNSLISAAVTGKIDVRNWKAPN